MRYQDIEEKKRQMDFRLTEPETLVKLVNAAQVKGEKVQEDMRRLKNISSKIGKIFEEKSIIFTEKDLENIPLKYERAVGIDGSFQLVGGAGGKWYAPISVARITFERPGSQPTVDIFWADIEEIDERDDPKPNVVAAVLMLSYETKAILNWGTQEKESYAFLDGPIVDPPVFSYGGKDYIKDRCQAIDKCFEKSILIGCVKRSRDRFYIEHIAKNIDPSESQSLDAFPSDQHLMAYVFSATRSNGYYGPLFTSPIDVSEVNSVYKTYEENGINIVSLFFQKGIMSQVLRLDIPFKQEIKNNPAVNETVLFAVKAATEWTYPGQDYPLPVFLAHDKCNIREGCAEVLYEEIMTKSRTVDPTNQAILSLLR